MCWEKMVYIFVFSRKKAIRMMIFFLGFEKVFENAGQCSAFHRDAVCVLIKIRWWKKIEKKNMRNLIWEYTNRTRFKHVFH